MLQHHQRHDVAGRLKVPVTEIEFSSEADQVLRRAHVQDIRLAGVAGHRVAQVRHTSRCSRHIPAAPAILKRSAVVGGGIVGARRGHAARVGVDRADQ